MIKHNIEPQIGQHWDNIETEERVSICEANDREVVIATETGFVVVQVSAFLRRYKLHMHQSGYVLEDGYEYEEREKPDHFTPPWATLADGGSSTYLHRRPLLMPVVAPPKLVEYEVNPRNYEYCWLTYTVSGCIRFLHTAPNFPNFVGYVFELPNGERVTPTANIRIYWKDSISGGYWSHMWTEGCTVLTPVAVAFLEDFE